MKHFSKTFILSLFFASVLFSISCTSETPDVNNKEDQNKNDFFIKRYVQQISGTWKIKKMVLVSNNLSDTIKHDTILYDVGNITIEAVDNSIAGKQIRFGLKGYFNINYENIPFHVQYLIPMAAEKLAVGLFEVTPNYLPSTESTPDELSTEYQFLEGYFFRDNYTISLSEDENIMILEGLNRSAKELILRRIN